MRHTVPRQTRGRLHLVHEAGRSPRALCSNAQRRCGLPATSTAAYRNDGTRCCCCSAQTRQRGQRVRRRCPNDPSDSFECEEHRQRALMLWHGHHLERHSSNVGSPRVHAACIVRVHSPPMSLVVLAVGAERKVDDQRHGGDESGGSRHKSDTSPAAKRHKSDTRGVP